MCIDSRSHPCKFIFYATIIVGPKKMKKGNNATWILLFVLFLFENIELVFNSLFVTVSKVRKKYIKLCETFRLRLILV